MGFEAVAEELFLNLNSLVHRQADAFIDRLLAVAHRDRGVLGDLAGELEGVLHQFGLRVDRVDQADAQRFVGLDVERRVDELLGHAHADKAGQPLGAAEARRDAKAHFGLAEDGVVAAQADVAAHGELIAAAERETVDRRDDRQREVLNHQEDIVAELAESLAFGLGHRGHRADVGAGHKALFARAGEHHAAHGVLVNALKRGLEVGEDFGVQRIERLRPVDRNDRHRALQFGFNKRHWIVPPNSKSVAVGGHAPTTATPLQKSKAKLCAGSAATSARFCFTFRPKGIHRGKQMR